MKRTIRWLSKQGTPPPGVSAGTTAAAAKVLLGLWEEMLLLPPCSHTARAVDLLSTTVSALETSSVSCKDTLPRSSAGSQDGKSDSEFAKALLGAKPHSDLIWRALRRQRVPWLDALRLAPAQLAVLPAEQQTAIRRKVKHRPWNFSLCVLASWETPTPEMTRIYKALRACTDTVQFAKQLAAALRPRPELHGVLPVPADVLLHLYALGEAGTRQVVSKTDSSSSTASAMALRLCKHASLLSRNTVSKRTREDLALGYARLHAGVGDWASALTVVKGDPAVRLSARRAMEEYVSDRMLWARALAWCGAAESGRSAEEGDGNEESVQQKEEGSESAQQRHPQRRLTEYELAVAVRSAPYWRCALAVVHHFPNSDAARAAYLTRLDRPSILKTSGAAANGTGETPAWRKPIDDFIQLAPAHQTYGVLRPLLEAIPPLESSGVLVSTNALQHVAPRMYAGALTRRLASFASRGQWRAALALGCAAGAYDLASPFTRPLLASVPNCELPSEVLAYERAACALTAPLSTDNGAVLYAQLTAAELLAHALHGDWRQVARTVQALSIMQGGGAGTFPGYERLRCFLSAKLKTESGEDSLGEVQPHTFQSSEHSHLVFGCASEKDQAYFLKVISASLRAHHNSCSAVSRAIRIQQNRNGILNDDTSATAMYAKVARSTEDCHRLCQSIAHQIRTRGGGSNSSNNNNLNSSGLALVKALAKITAKGCVDLPGPERSGLTVAALKASTALGTSLDAMAAVKALSAVPAARLDACPEALTAGLDALALLGMWETALRHYSRMHHQRGKETHNTHSSVSHHPGTAAFSTSVSSKSSFSALAAALEREETALHVTYQAPSTVAARLARRVHSQIRSLQMLSRSTSYTQKTSRDFTREVPLSLLVQELLRGDARQTSQELLRHTVQGSKNHHLSGSVLQRRRALLGASFSLLTDESALTQCVRACGVAKVGPSDLDAHGLQRLLRVLSWETALAALVELSSTTTINRDGLAVVHEHWVVLVMTKTDIPLSAMREAAQLVTYSYLAQSILTFAGAVRGRRLLQDADVSVDVDPVLALRALLRYWMLTAPSMSSSYGDGSSNSSSSSISKLLMLPLVVMLRQFLESDAVLETLLRSKPDSKVKTDRVTLTLSPLNTQEVKSKADVCEQQLGSTTEPEKALVDDELDDILNFDMDDATVMEDMLGGIADHATATLLLQKAATHQSPIQRAAAEFYQRLMQDPALSAALLKDRREHRDTFRALDPASSLLLLGTAHYELSRRCQVPVPASLTSRLLDVARDATDDWLAALQCFKRLRKPTCAERAALVTCLRLTPGSATGAALGTRRFLRGYPEQAVAWCSEMLGEMKWRAALDLLMLREETEEEGSEAVARTSHAMEAKLRLLVADWNWAECLRVVEVLKRSGYDTSTLGSSSDGEAALVLRVLVERQAQCTPPSSLLPVQASPKKK